MFWLFIAVLTFLKFILSYLKFIPAKPVTACAVKQIVKILYKSLFARVTGGMAHLLLPTLNIDEGQDTPFLDFIAELFCIYFT